MDDNGEYTMHATMYGCGAVVNVVALLSPALRWNLSLTTHFSPFIWLLQPSYDVTTDRS